MCMGLGLTSCIDDSFTTDPNDVLTFSVDTVKFDTVMTMKGTSTKQFIIYNRSKKQINISSTARSIFSLRTSKPVAERCGVP